MTRPRDGLLVDTHVLLWWLYQPERVSEIVSARLCSADGTAFVSVASLWEIAVKRRIGKLNVPDNLPALVFADNRFDLLPISVEHVWRTARLELRHRDPFDRLLIAQALIEGLTVATADRRFAEYGVTVLSA